MPPIKHAQKIKYCEAASARQAAIAAVQQWLQVVSSADADGMSWETAAREAAARDVAERLVRKATYPGRNFHASGGSSCRSWPIPR